MAKRTDAEKELARQARIQRAEARRQRLTERRQRSEQAMAQGPDVYAKRIIASWLQMPFVHFWYSLLYMICDYVLGGHIIVKNWQKLLVRAGYVSEGALGVAGVWALINHVAIIHNLLAGNPVTKQVIDPMNAFMMAAFTLIPDLILASAILMTFGRWGDCKNKEGRGAAVLWALVYSACTITFFCLTIYTLSTVGSVASSGDITKVVYASGTELQIRVISSFLYGLSEIVYAYTHKGQHSTVLQPAQPPAPTVDIAAILKEQAEKHEQITRELAEQHRQEMVSLSQSNNLQRIETQRLLTQIEELKQQVETPQIAGPAVSEEGLVDAVMKRLEARFETFLAQQARVSPATETPQIAGPAVSEEALITAVMKRIEARSETSQRRARTVSEVRESETGQHRALKGSRSTESASEQENGDSNVAVVEKHLEKDRSLNHRALARLTGISESTCYRIRKAWIKAHPVVSSDPNEQLEEEGEEAAI
jgi:hypothetical protein